MKNDHIIDLDLIQIWHMKTDAKNAFARSAGTVIPDFLPDNYELVAVLEYEDVKQNAIATCIYGMLDSCFQMTNSIESHWTNNRGVWGGSDARSTSIGDVIRLASGQKFRIDDFGFTEF
tara:strand:- start:46 stop:402 length:357 start_codon:yes stop_codon:yes gene_type:complete